ncbi:uncharacterized protein EI90DRAFT_3077620 [Cantharellus anzutake]|uniref:uncharacterized protein n=1 Tax=Cantharellus anzutake TaxID=1750568 RepID=UPI001907EBB9|nr:uncharacterized protein EI90DRAFT_3077620 [Cantharellus anzutake]KAF8322858.1 hypothetical protein EI90DRAFT_3077620 [Cantharellus anzutake]
MYFSRFPFIPIWTTASFYSSQLVIIPTSPHPPAPLGLALSTSFRTYHRSCPMTFGTAPPPLPFVPIRTDFLLTYCEIKDQMDKQQWHSAPLESLRPRSLHAKSPIPLRSPNFGGDAFIPFLYSQFLTLM